MQDNINQNSSNQSIPESKSKLWIYSSVFLGIIIIVGGGYLVWSNYLSPEIRAAREHQKLYEETLGLVEQYQEAMRNDTYGGTTPQETLDLFVEALENDDLEMASKYFVLNDDGTRDPIILENLKILRDNGEIIEVMATIEKLEYSETRSYEGTAWFYSGDHSILIKLNEHSKVWKIESL